MHYLSIHFHPILTREFVGSVSRDLDDWPFLIERIQTFAARRETMYEDDSYQQLETALLCIGKALATEDEDF